MSPSPVVATEGLCLAYRDKLALDHLTMSLPAGGIHALVGANGAGKSSLFRVLLGFDTAQAGQVRVFGIDSRRLTPATRARIGFVDDSHALPSWMTVAALCAMQRRLYPAWKQARYDEVLSEFALTERQLVGELSRGQRAGLNLALALAQDPALLILDEPTLGLDVVAKRSFLEALLFSRDESAMTVLYASHHVDEIERIADTLVLLDRGRLHDHTSLEGFVARASIWSFSFTGDHQDLRNLPGVRELRSFEDRLQLTVFDAGADFSDHLHRLGASQTASVPASLEQAIGGSLRPVPSTAQ